MYPTVVLERMSLRPGRGARAFLAALSFFWGAGCGGVSCHSPALCLETAGASGAPQSEQIVGTWEISEEGEERLLRFSRDGTFNFVNFSGNYSENGTYRLKGSVLIQDGNGVEGSGARQHRANSYEYGSGPGQWEVSEMNLSFHAESGAYYRRVSCLGPWVRSR